MTTANPQLATNLVVRLDQQAAANPQRPAIISGSADRPHPLSFGDLAEQSRLLAMGLAHQGIGPGDAVLLLVPMSPQLYLVLIALFRLGAIALFLDPAAGSDHIQRCCAMIPPKALVTTAKGQLLRLRYRRLRQIPLAYVSQGWLPGCKRLPLLTTPLPGWQQYPASVDHPALVTFTSGSTGQPKAAVRSHGFLLNQHRVLAKAIDLQPGQIDLTTLPIFLLANLASGVTSVIPDGDLRRIGAVDAAPIIAQIQKWQINRSAASPAFFARLAATCRNQGQRLTSLQRLDSGGAPVFPRLLDDCGQFAPNALIEAVYGSTEAEPIAHQRATEISSDDRQQMAAGAGLLSGRPIADIALAIIPNRWGQPIPPRTRQQHQADYCPPQVSGEIVVSGSHVLPGYLDGKGDDETKFKVDGQIWHRTGDAGYLDHQGRLWLLGRCMARIVDGKGELYPFAVETAAMEQRAVTRAALVAVKGQRLLALELDQGCDQQAVVTALSDQLAWAQLDRLLVVAAIPVDKRHNAKVDYPALSRLLDGAFNEH